MAKRPTWLVMVNHGASGIELFSAHHNEKDAQRMHARLQSLLRATTSQAYLVEVPTAAGVTEQKFSPQPAPEPKKKWMSTEDLGVDSPEPEPETNGKGAPEEAAEEELDYGRWV